MPVVGADPERLRELAHQLDAAASDIERTLAPAYAAVQTGWAPFADDPTASGQWWRTVQAMSVALHDSAAQLRARADALEADQRCAEGVDTALGLFGFGFVLDAGALAAQGHFQDAFATANLGTGTAMMVDMGFRGGEAMLHGVGAAAAPVAVVATIGEIYCMTPIGGPTLPPTVNHQRGDDDEDWVDEDHIANTAGFTNCDGDCLAQLQGR
jgi:hypothetical protein